MVIGSIVKIRIKITGEVSTDSGIKKGCYCFVIGVSLLQGGVRGGILRYFAFFFLDKKETKNQESLIPPHWLHGIAGFQASRAASISLKNK